MDAWLVPRYVREHNEEQERRESSRLPPVALAFLGDDPDTSLEGEPPWIEKLTGLSSVVGDVCVLTVAGVGLGAISAEAGDFGPVLAGLVGGWFESTIATFLIVYAFAVPVGATLSRPLLARRPRGELWGLTAWAAVCVLLGMAAG